ncbi:ovarian tumor isoform X2 [Haematobia irritans]|uniref:ovarian tumor isoform X2 n=1 Tax=Haematobia irritans TaxID=7368 RepID=UPI003F506CF9
MQQRQFTSGSRQAPDPYDQFLEEHQFYRKHTARDASCLFRVISEQMYDTQLHHLVIREKCVTYMRKHREFFENHIERDFDEYLDDMSKPKTYGTLLELQAAGSLFERNVILFEPFDLGKYFNEHRSYFKEVFRVFYTPERHFDSVFTSEYIQEAAICQSICYEILYKDLFKLPDVAFAVEQMLHGPNFENMEYTTETNDEGYATRIFLSDGREFELDLPHNTNCILENFKLCHFHYTNFPRFSDDLQRGLKEAHHDDNEKNTLIIQRTTESFLPNKYMSCVRQLLQESITPFPYKVAKALDPNMYRNIEFDSWNEMRKEIKLQNWYNGDSNFKVGAKCHVKLRKSEQDLYTCHIQEIAVDKGQCIVFVEQLGEKRLVPYENLTPLPPDQFKPWTVPYRFQRQMQKFSSVRFTRQYRFKFNSTTEHHHHQFHQQFCGSGIDNDSCANSSDYIIDDDPKRSLYKLRQYTHLENFRTQTTEYCTMPFSTNHNGGESMEKNIGQQRGGDSNDNNRTISRSTNNNHCEGGATIKTEPNQGEVFQGSEDHMGIVAPAMGYAVHQGDGIYEIDHYNPNAGTAMYLPEMQSLYPMYPYAPAGSHPEDYYGYCGYDGSIAPAPAYMSTVNNVNGYYYVCSNGPAPPGSFVSTSAGANQFIAAHQPIGIPAPTQNLAVYAQAPPPPFNSSSAATNYTAVQVSGSTLPSNAQSSNQRHTSSPHVSRGGNQNSANTPLSGRINFDARKSYKATGADLPKDTATLRYFYNLGLEYYHQKQATKSQTANEASESSKTTDVANDELEALTNDMQNIRLDENANQVSTTTKQDANNNNVVADTAGGSTTADKPRPSAPAPQQNPNQNNKNSNAGNSMNAGGNKNNPRRYSSRCFNNKDRPMMHQHQQQRNHMNSNLHVPYSNGHNQQYQSSRNSGNTGNNKNGSGNMGAGGGGYQTSTTPNSSRNVQNQNSNGPSVPPPHPGQLHPPISVSEHSAQSSPMTGYDEALMINDTHNCNTPTSNNSNANPVVPYGPYVGAGEQLNDGMCGGPYGIPLTANGLFVPMPMASTTGPPPPYGLYAAHPPPPTGYHSTSSAGVHGNFTNGGPTMHFGPPPPLPPGVANSTASGSDTTETNAADVMNNNVGVINVGNGLAPFQCTSYPPPPPMPYYYTSGGIPPGNNTVANGGGVHLVAQMAPPTPTGHASMQQPYGAAPHPPMGHQGYFCLPPPPPHAQQMPPLPPPPPMQQTSTTNNPNNNCARPDISTPNE